LKFSKEGKMEKRNQVIPARLRRVGTIFIGVIGAVWVIFLLVSIFAKPVYTPFGALAAVIGVLVLSSVLCGVLVLLDYLNKEGTQ
jgi:hypothetical protein